MMFSQGKIAKDELDKAGKIESDLDMLEDKHNLKNFFDEKDMGIEHALLPEKGLVVPGDVIIGADSHTCTHGALGAFSTGMGSTDISFGMITGGNWFKVPESIKVVFKGKPSQYVTGKDLILEIIRIFIGCISLVFINTFVNTIINKSDALLYSILGIIIITAALHFLHVIDVFAISEKIFYTFYTHWFTFLIPFILLIIIGFYTFSFIKNNLYLDKGLEMKKSVGKTENIAFLNKYGTLGTFINNDIRLIKRSKAARSALIGGVLFLFYGLLFFNKGYESSFMQVFLGIFVTGGFNFIFGQRVPAWDSSYYPLMMTQKVPYKDYLKAKWAMFVIAIGASMILAIGYACISWEFYVTIFAGNYPVLSVLGIFIGCISLVFINTFVNTIINKSDALLYSILGIIIITAALHFLHIIDVFVTKYIF